MPIDINRAIENLQTLSDYVTNDDSEWKSLKNFIDDGNDPKEHILFVAFTTLDDSKERLEEWENELKNL